MSTEQRRAAYGVLLVLCALWAAFGTTMLVGAYRTSTGMDGSAGYLSLLAMVGAGVVLLSVGCLVAGIVTMRRITAGWWPWRPFGAAAAAGAVVSVSGAVAVSIWLPVVGALLVLQGLALLALVAMSRPTSPSRQPF